MNPELPLLSIIIPIGPKEKSYIDLIDDLCELFKGHESCVEIILAGIKGEDLDTPSPQSKLKIQKVFYKKGRAFQLNFGAKACKGVYLWFLHADSRPGPLAFDRILTVLEAHPRGIHYFNLKFLHDGPGKMAINTFGVRLRSDLFKIPFGDQGFLMRKSIFEELGGYREDLKIQEDHDFIWRARIKGISLLNIGRDLYTSARKYKNNGWGKTTLHHLKLTYQLAIPYWLKTLKTFYP